MGFQDDKSSVVDQVGTFKVLSGLPKPKKFNSFDSINSKSKNLLPFILDLLKSSCADNAQTVKQKLACEGTRILLEVLIEFLPVLNKIVKEGLVEAIKVALACGSDFTIQTPTPTISIDVKNIDFRGMMKMDRNGIGSNLLFGRLDKDLNSFLNDIVKNQSSGTWSDRNGNGLIDASFNPTTQKMDLSINSYRGGKSFHQFLVDFVNSTEIFSLKTMTASLMDQLTGCISANLNLGLDIMLDDVKMDKTIDKILEVDECEDKIRIDDSFFEFTNDELILMEELARNRSIGVNVMDLGCGLVEVAIPLSLLSELSELDNDISPKLVNDILEKTIDRVGNNIASISTDNGSTMKTNFGFQANLSLSKIITKLTLTPKVMALYQLSYKTIDDSIVDVKSSYDFSVASRTFFKFVVKESAAAILEIFFNKLKKELIDLIQRVITKIIKEKIRLYAGSIAGIFLSVADKAVDSIGDAAAGGINSIQTPNTSNFV